MRYSRRLKSWVLIAALAGSVALVAHAQQAPQDARSRVGPVVVLDAWFNSQKRPDAAGRLVYYHYKWEDETDGGYSLLGQLFRESGAKTETLYTAPTAAALARAQIYIVVSPDIPAKNPDPHYMRKEDAAVVAAWVKAGGVLLLMENDPANADIDHLNLLSELFGIHYNKVLHNHVEGDRFEMGKIVVEAGGEIFHNRHTLFMKDTCTITATDPAIPILRDGGDTLMAVAKYGKGTVFATVDPWLYNEYTDGHRLPTAYDNFAAGKEFVRWVVAQAAQ
jgi:unsaturated rhamnogalacturonyl hydrolase